MPSERFKRKVTRVLLSSKPLTDDANAPSRANRAALKEILEQSVESGNIDLSCRHLNSDTMILLGGTSAVLRTVHEINVSCSTLDLDAAFLLLDAVRKNSSVTSVLVDGVNAPQGWMEEMQVACEENIEILKAQEEQRRESEARRRQAELDAYYSQAFRKLVSEGLFVSELYFEENKERRMIRRAYKCVAEIGKEVQRKRDNQSSLIHYAFTFVDGEAQRRVALQLENVEVRMDLLLTADDQVRSILISNESAERHKLWKGLCTSYRDSTAALAHRLASEKAARSKTEYEFTLGRGALLREQMRELLELHAESEGILLKLNSEWKDVLLREEDERRRARVRMEDETRDKAFKEEARRKEIYQRSQDEEFQRNKLTTLEENARLRVSRLAMTGLNCLADIFTQQREVVKTRAALFEKCRMLEKHLAVPVVLRIISSRDAMNPLFYFEACNDWAVVDKHMTVSLTMPRGWEERLAKLRNEALSTAESVTALRAAKRKKLRTLFDQLRDTSRSLKIDLWSTKLADEVEGNTEDVRFSREGAHHHHHHHRGNNPTTVTSPKDLAKWDQYYQAIFADLALPETFDDKGVVNRQSGSEVLTDKRILRNMDVTVSVLGSDFTVLQRRRADKLVTAEEPKVELAEDEDEEKEEQEQRTTAASENVSSQEPPPADEPTGEGAKEEDEDEELLFAAALEERSLAAEVENFDVLDFFWEKDSMRTSHANSRRSSMRKVSSHDDQTTTAAERRTSFRAFSDDDHGDLDSRSSPLEPAPPPFLFTFQSQDTAPEGLPLPWRRRYELVPEDEKEAGVDEDGDDERKQRLSVDSKQGEDAAAEEKEAASDGDAKQDQEEEEPASPDGAGGDPTSVFVPVDDQRATTTSSSSPTGERKEKEEDVASRDSSPLSGSSPSSLSIGTVSGEEEQPRSGSPASFSSSKGQRSERDENAISEPTEDKKASPIDGQVLEEEEEEPANTRLVAEQLLHIQEFLRSLKYKNTARNFGVMIQRYIRIEMDINGSTASTYLPICVCQTFMAPQQHSLEVEGKELARLGATWAVRDIPVTVKGTSSDEDYDEDEMFEVATLISTSFTATTTDDSAALSLFVPDLYFNAVAAADSGVRHQGFAASTLVVEFVDSHGGTFYPQEDRIVFDPLDKTIKVILGVVSIDGVMVGHVEQDCFVFGPEGTPSRRHVFHLTEHGSVRKEVLARILDALRYGNIAATPVIGKRTIRVTVHPRGAAGHPVQLSVEVSAVDVPTTMEIPNQKVVLHWSETKNAAGPLERYCFMKPPYIKKPLLEDVFAAAMAQQRQSVIAAPSVLSEHDPQSPTSPLSATMTDVMDEESEVVWPQPNVPTVYVAPNALVIDPDTDKFSSGTCKVWIHRGFKAGDHLWVANTDGRQNFLLPPSFDKDDPRRTATEELLALQLEEAKGGRGPLPASSLHHQRQSLGGCSNASSDTTGGPPDWMQHSPVSRFGISVIPTTAAIIDELLEAKKKKQSSTEEQPQELPAEELGGIPVVEEEEDGLNESLGSSLGCTRQFVDGQLPLVSTPGSADDFSGPTEESTKAEADECSRTTDEGDERKKEQKNAPPPLEPVKPVTGGSDETDDKKEPTPPPVFDRALVYHDGELLGVLSWDQQRLDDTAAFHDVSDAIDHARGSITTQQPDTPASTLVRKAVSRLKRQKSMDIGDAPFTTKLLRLEFSDRGTASIGAIQEFLRCVCFSSALACPPIAPRDVRIEVTIGDSTNRMDAEGHLVELKNQNETLRGKVVVRVTPPILKLPTAKDSKKAAVASATASGATATSRSGEGSAPNEFQYLEKSGIKRLPLLDLLNEEESMMKTTNFGFISAEVWHGSCEFDELMVKELEEREFFEGPSSFASKIIVRENTIAAENLLKQFANFSPDFFPEHPVEPFMRVKERPPQQAPSFTFGRRPSSPPFGGHGKKKPSILSVPTAAGPPSVEDGSGSELGDGSIKRVDSISSVKGQPSATTTSSTDATAKETRPSSSSLGRKRKSIVGFEGQSPRSDSARKASTTGPPARRTSTMARIKRVDSIGDGTSPQELGLERRASAIIPMGEQSSLPPMSSSSGRLSRRLSETLPPPPLCEWCPMPSALTLETLAEEQKAEPSAGESSFEATLSATLTASSALTASLENTQRRLSASGELDTPRRMSTSFAGPAPDSPALVLRRKLLYLRRSGIDKRLNDSRRLKAYTFTRDGSIIATAYTVPGLCVVTWRVTLNRRDISYLLRSLSYRNTDPDPETLAKKMKVSFYDGSSPSTVHLDLKIIPVEDPVGIMPHKPQLTYRTNATEYNHYEGPGSEQMLSILTHLRQAYGGALAPVVKRRRKSLPHQGMLQTPLPMPVTPPPQSIQHVDDAVVSEGQGNVGVLRLFPMGGVTLIDPDIGMWDKGTMMVDVVSGGAKPECVTLISIDQQRRQYHICGKHVKHLIRISQQQSQHPSPAARGLQLLDENENIVCHNVGVLLYTSRQGLPESCHILFNKKKPESEYCVTFEVLEYILSSLCYSFTGHRTENAQPQGTQQPTPGPRSVRVAIHDGRNPVPGKASVTIDVLPALLATKDKAFSAEAKFTRTKQPMDNFPIFQKYNYSITDTKFLMTHGGFIEVFATKKCPPLPLAASASPSGSRSPPQSPKAGAGDRRATFVPPPPMPPVLEDAHPGDEISLRLHGTQLIIREGVLYANKDEIGPIVSSGPYLRINIPAQNAKLANAKRVTDIIKGLFIQFSEKGERRAFLTIGERKVPPPTMPVESGTPQQTTATTAGPSPPQSPPGTIAEEFVPGDWELSVVHTNLFVQ